MTSRTGNSMIDSMLDLQSKQYEIVKPISILDGKNIDVINDISELANIINKSPIDLKRDEDLSVAKKFLAKVAEKLGDKNKIEYLDYDIIKIEEKKAFTKISESVRLLSKYNEIKEKVVKDSSLEIKMLNDFIDAEKLILSQSQDSLKVLSENVVDTKKTKKESKEKREELKLEKDEEKAIIKYLGLSESDFKDINLLSAISVLSKNNGNLSTKEDWEKAGYDESGIIFQDSELKQLNKLPSTEIRKLQTLKAQGISILDLVNTIEVAKSNGESKVFETIFDYNTDGFVNLGDKNINNSDAILAYVNKMISEGREKRLFKSMSFLTNENISNKKDLYDLVINKPEIKFNIINKIKSLTGAGDAGSTFVTDIFEYGEKATKVSMEKKKESEKYISNILDSKKEKVIKSYDIALEEFKKSLSAEDKVKYEALISSLSAEESKKSIWDNFRLNGLGILVNLVDNHKGVGGAASFTNEKVNDFLISNTESIVKGLNFELGIANMGGQYLPGVGMSIDLSKDLSAETKAFGKVGIINIFPYAMLGLETQLNADSIKKSGFANLSDSTKYAGASVNISTLGWGAMLHYRKDQLKSIETQEKSFSEFIDKLLSSNGLNEEIVKKQSDYEQNKGYYDILVSNIKDTLRLQNFSSSSVEQRNQLINSIKTSYEYMWRENILKAAEKEGYKFSGIGFGVEFIAGFMPLPVLGVSASKVGTTYDENKLSKVYAIISEAKNVVIKKQTTFNDGELVLNSNEVNTGMDFEGHKPLFRNIAQKHPKTWEKLVTSRGLSLESEADLISSILKTDANKNTKFFKELIKNIDLYKKSNSTEDLRKLNELIAGFYDISFADIRSTSEVIMGYTKKGNKYEGTFNFQESRKKAMSRFAAGEGLSNDFVKENQEIVLQIRESHLAELKAYKTGKLKKSPEIEQIKDPTLFALVASYKIDSKGHSLGKSFVDIPAGQANLADGITKEITQDKDKNYLLNEYMKSSSSKNAINQITSTINAKEEGLISSSDDFKKLMLNGYIEKNGKRVSISRDFVYFLYGQCANESMGLRIKGLKFEGFNTSREVEEVTYGNIAPDGVLAVQTNTTNIPRGVLSTIAIGVVGTNGDDRKDTNSGNPETPTNNGGSGSSNLGGATGDGTGGGGTNVGTGGGRG